MRLFWATSLLFLLLFGFTTYWPTKMRVERLRKKEEKLKREIQKLREENQKLKRKIQAIREDPYYLEFLVRREFRWIREGEKLVR